MPRLPAGQDPCWLRTVKQRLEPLRGKKARAVRRVDDWAALFLEHLLTIGYQPTTIAHYYYDLRRFAAWCEQSDLVLVRRIQRAHVTEFLRYRMEHDGVGRHVVRFLRHRLCVFFGYRQTQGVVHAANPAAGIGFYAGHAKRSKPVLTSDECERLVRAPLEWTEHPRGTSTAQECYVRAHRDAAMLALMVGSGLRRTEVAELTVENLSLEAGVIRVVGKGRQRLFRVERDVFLHSTAIREIGLYLACTGHRSKGPLFLCLDGHPIHPTAVAFATSRYGRWALGRHVSPHDLRHTFATHLIRRGADAHSAQRLLGHKDVATTLHYYLHLTDDEVREEWRKTCPVRRRSNA